MIKIFILNKKDLLGIEKIPFGLLNYSILKVFTTIIILKY